MKVTFYGLGQESHGAWEAYDEERQKELDLLFDEITIELQRVPCVGETVMLTKGDYTVEAEVTRVYTNWYEPGNPHIKPRAYGDSYACQLDKAEVVDYMGDRR